MEDGATSKVPVSECISAITAVKIHVLEAVYCSI